MHILSLQFFSFSYQYGVCVTQSKPVRQIRVFGANASNNQEQC